MHTRDYSLTGPDGALAVERGLASAAWYHSDIPRKTMKALMQRSDQPALRDTAIWLGAMVVFGGLGAWSWGTWWCLPCFAAYGVFYGSASDSRWHECGHGTAFRTGWMNDAVYQLACFMIMRSPVTWRWSHSRHHTDTVIVGRDPEIVMMRPAKVLRILGNFFGVFDVLQALRLMLLNAGGRLDPQEALYIPESERRRVFRVARVWCLIYAATAAAALYLQSILPFVLIGLPRLYGCWHMVLVGILQHGGLAENVLDHRLNSRTVMLNPISRFIYWNMNYHVEHHMFPMVPYHALPKLHALLRDDLPAPTPNLWQGYKEVIRAVRIQRRNPDWFIKRALPPTAKPYRPEFHGDIEPRMADPVTGRAAA
ncbi:fatty acid desaturase family protein [Dongia sp. agr-C8]